MGSRIVGMDFAGGKTPSIPTNLQLPTNVSAMGAHRVCTRKMFSPFFFLLLSPPFPSIARREISIPVLEHSSN